MQLWERGSVDLDAPANQYLRAFKLIPAHPGFRQPTVRHLLTSIFGAVIELRLGLARVCLRLRPRAKSR